MPEYGSSHGSSIVRLPLARWMTVRCNPSLYLLLATPMSLFPLGRDLSDLDSFNLPHRIPSFSNLVGFIVWTYDSITKEGLDDKRADTLFDDYVISVGLILIAPSEIRLPDRS